MPARELEQWLRRPDPLDRAAGRTTAPHERYVAAMDEQTTKDHIHAHADAVVRGDMDTVIADLSEELQPQAPQLAAGLPMPVTERRGAEPRLRGGRGRGADPLRGRQRRGHFRSRWQDGDEHPVIVHVEPVG